MTDIPKHFLMTVQGRVAKITLDRPDRKNPLTFDSYAELREHYAAAGIVAFPTLADEWGLVVNEALVTRTSQKTGLRTACIDSS